MPDRSNFVNLQVVWQVGGAHVVSKLLCCSDFLAPCWMFVQEPDSIVCRSDRFQKLSPTCGKVQGRSYAIVRNAAHCIIALL